MNNVVDVLQRAKAVIQERGWQQESYGTPEGPVCAIGALRVVLTGSPTGGIPHDEYSIYRQSVWALGRTLNNHEDWDLYASDVVDYNDMPGRQVNEILEVFDNTIARLSHE